jgi:hypothetical protein
MFFTSDRHLVLIDADLAPFVSAHRWRVGRSGYVFSTYERLRKDGRTCQQTFSLHRRVAGFGVKEGANVLTWFRGSKLDCRRSNLAILDCSIF